MDMLTLIPALAAIFSLASFKQQRNPLCFAIILTSIVAEIAPPINITALIVCIACLSACLYLVSSKASGINASNSRRDVE